MKEIARRGPRLRFLYALPCFAFFSTLLVVVKQVFTDREYDAKSLAVRGSGNRNLQSVDDISQGCIPPSITSFPGDFFTQEERLKGGVVVHFLIVIYLCAMLAIVCDKYFLPSLEIISERMKLPTDIAGATFMAIGTSSPELFSSIIGSFITEGDIGVGTIVGSAVFNILGVTGLAGVVLWRSELDIDWYPISRDCLVYVATVAALIIILSNNIVTWWESLIMLVLYAIYIVIMYFNTKLEKFSHRQVKRLHEFWKFRGSKSTVEKKSPLVAEEAFLELQKNSVTQHQSSGSSFNGDVVAITHDDNAPAKDCIDGEKDTEKTNDSNLCSPPTKKVTNFIWWLVMWPASLMFYATIPNCQKKSCRNLFALAFLMSVLWLGLLSYLTVWMVTVIGFTLGIPDTVSGITILAAGSSVPEIISSVIVVNERRGNMAICNLIGSNIFDILFCLGAPWFVKTLSAEGGFLRINSSALTYTTATLLTTVVIMYIVFHISHWKLNRGVGFACIIIYAIFLTLTCMYELNFFGHFNPPTCPL